MGYCGLLLILAVLVAISAATSPNIVTIGLRTMSTFLGSGGDETDECNSKYSCYNCTTARICAPLPDNNGYKELRRINCEGKTPWCDLNTGSCSSVENKRCAKVGGFTCLSDGYFPDRKECTKFHYCQDLVSYTFSCREASYNYDAESHQCVYNKTCNTFNCQGKSGYKVAYPADPSIFAYCINDGAYAVDRCVGSNELNETSQSCGPVCKKEGLMKDSTDCRSYYKCNVESQDGTSITYSMTHHTCPLGQVFSAEEFQCTPSPALFCNQTTNDEP